MSLIHQVKFSRVANKKYRADDDSFARYILVDYDQLSIL